MKPKINNSMTRNSNNKTSYELAIVELHDDSVPRGQYSILLSIQKSMRAMPLQVVDGKPAVRVWANKDAVREVIQTAKQSIIAINASPQGNIKGFVASFKEKRKKQYLGYVVMMPDDGDVVQWSVVDPQKTEIDCFVSYSVSKAAQAQVSELMDSLSAYTIDWTQMRITPSELG
jgi:hypothetical protein